MGPGQVILGWDPDDQAELAGIAGQAPLAGEEPRTRERGEARRNVGSWPTGAGMKVVGVAAVQQQVSHAWWVLTGEAWTLSDKAAPQE